MIGCEEARKLLATSQRLQAKDLKQSSEEQGA